ncbi:Hemimethylated DNA-binding protein YccV like-domain-containing protein [Xylariaceae sp. FL0662B]|nr:Hemimethylated DNA-binding protein YccV like-domain-containing protein [Xylariaceae sp. FL0662B]
MSQVSSLLSLPDELLEDVASYLTASDTVAFGKSCKRTYKASCGPLLWREHCVRTWRYWEQAREFAEKLELPAIEVEWRQLYNKRAQTDRQALHIFNKMLSTQQYRLARMQEIAAYGYDVKDMFLRLKNETPDSAEDVLARRYYSKSILGIIHRAIALEKWASLGRGEPVKLEEAIGAYDLFVLSGERGDLTDIKNELDRIAKCVKDEVEEGDTEFDHLTTRQKALHIGRYLKSTKLIDEPDQTHFRSLRNNFISIALFSNIHWSLPLQSAVIYCAVAQRLGVDASPSNYPGHVHVVIQAPRGQTLDGEHSDVMERMIMGPWRLDIEVPEEHLRVYLSQIGISQDEHEHYLSPASTTGMALRTGHNIMASVQDLVAPPVADVSIEAASYSITWCAILLGHSDPGTATFTRRQYLRPLIEHFQVFFTEDVGLVEKILPLFEGEQEHQMLVELIQKIRADDSHEKTPLSRYDQPVEIQYRVGQHVRHSRYEYTGFIIGWDNRCLAPQVWIDRMQVNYLPRGTNQPFYRVIYDGRSTHYLAEDDIEVLHESPRPELMGLAGRYFKRWDEEKMMFESNIRDEYLLFP